MTAGGLLAERKFSLDWRTAAPDIATGVAFLFLFWQPVATLARDWWIDPDSGHGLLLGPLAIYLAWRVTKGRRQEATPPWMRPSPPR